MNQARDVFRVVAEVAVHLDHNLRAPLYRPREALGISRADAALVQAMDHLDAIGADG
jgi:hypothetical protein